MGWGFVLFSNRQTLENAFKRSDQLELLMENFFLLPLPWKLGVDPLLQFAFVKRHPNHFTNKISFIRESRRPILGHGITFIGFVCS